MLPIPVSSSLLHSEEAEGVLRSKKRGGAVVEGLQVEEGVLKTLEEVEVALTVHQERLAQGVEAGRHQRSRSFCCSKQLSWLRKDML